MPQAGIHGTFLHKLHGCRGFIKTREKGVQLSTKSIMLTASAIHFINVSLDLFIKKIISAPSMGRKSQSA